MGSSCSTIGHDGHVLLEIRGQNFPGRSWHVEGRPSHNIHVGIQLDREPSDLVPGDSPTHVWRTGIEVRQQDGGTDFRGSAVHGRRGSRFVYLTWGDVGTDGGFTMFRRAKLMLNDLVPLVSAEQPAQRVIATVDLTDECGGPRCARLSPPALELRKG